MYFHIKGIQHRNYFWYVDFNIRLWYYNKILTTIFENPVKKVLYKKNTFCVTTNWTISRFKSKNGMNKVFIFLWIKKVCYEWMNSYINELLIKIR